MRILQVNSARHFGGGETHVIQLIEGLKRLGHDVRIAGRTKGAISPDVPLPFLNAGDFLTALKLRRILRTESIDILHAHLARDYPIVAAAAWTLKETRVICTRHLLYPVKRHVLYRRIDGWLAPTGEIAKTLQPLRPRKIAVVPNWVDVHRFAFQPHGPHDPTVVGILGQISPHKGHDDAVDAMRLLGKNFRLVIAGRGSDEYVASLRSRTADMDVAFSGFVPVSDFFQSIDVLLMPSWEEPFGIVLLEAMASGVPVVATARGGPLEIVRDGVDGLLVEPRDAQALAIAVRRVCAEEGLRRSMTENARRRVEQKYGMRDQIAKVAAFYEEILTA